MPGPLPVLCEMTEPERMFHKQDRKPILVGAVAGATSEVRVRRRYVYDEHAQLQNQKIKWTVMNSGVCYFGFTMSLGELRSGVVTLDGKLDGDGLPVIEVDGGRTFVKVGAASSEWGDPRVGQYLIGDIARTAKYLAENPDAGEPPRVFEAM